MKRFGWGRLKWYGIASLPFPISFFCSRETEEINQSPAGYVYCMVIVVVFGLTMRFYLDSSRCPLRERKTSFQVYKIVSTSAALSLIWDAWWRRSTSPDYIIYPELLNIHHAWRVLLFKLIAEINCWQGLRTQNPGWCCLLSSVSHIFSGLCGWKCSEAWPLFTG
jgi:hypothetical protein